MSEQKHIIVLGAGYGGILTAKKLEKKFRRDDNVKITVIDKNTYHSMLTELHEVAAGRVPETAIRINLDKVFAGRKVDIILDRVTDIDFQGRTLHGTVRNYTYDYLVIGTGSKPTYFGVEGAKENAFTLWSYEDAIRIKNHVLDVFGRASVETDPDKRRRLLTFMVIGCGFTGIEMIGELAEYKSTLCENFNINPDEVRMIVADMLPKVLPAFDDKLIAKTVKRLEKMGVEIMTSSQVSKVDADYVIMNEEETIETNTVIWTVGVEGSEVVESIEDNEAVKAGRHRILTDKYLRAEKLTCVYVVGDNIYYVPEGEERPVPQMVENAEHSASLVAENIYNDINGKELNEYKPKFHGAMVCIGGKYGVAQVGTPSKQYVVSGFIAMLIKHLINMVYFLQVAGFNKIWSYMMHEFFHVPDRRSFVGGHFSKRSPNFWLVPLRLFVGFKWFMEGYDKIQKVFEDPGNIFLIPTKVAAGADAVAAASQSAEEAASYGEALPVPDFVKAMVDGMMDIMFYNSEGGFTFMAYVFQTVMVIGEIAVGLMLLAGLFTAVASLGSIVMGLMIWSSGMAPTEMLWYMIAGIALIGGSGSTFGLDYYVLPLLKKLWKQIPFVRKWYLYTD